MLLRLHAFCKLLQSYCGLLEATAAAGSAARWELRPLGALQTRQRLAHVAWNPSLSILAAFTMEDGSLHTVDALPQVTPFVDHLMITSSIVPNWLLPYNKWTVVKPLRWRLLRERCPAAPCRRGRRGGSRPR